MMLSQVTLKVCNIKKFIIVILHIEQVTPCDNFFVFFSPFFSLCIVLIYGLMTLLHYEFWKFWLKSLKTEVRTYSSEKVWSTIWDVNNQWSFFLIHSKWSSKASCTNCHSTGTKCMCRKFVGSTSRLPKFFFFHASWIRDCRVICVVEEFIHISESLKFGNRPLYVQGLTSPPMVQWPTLVSKFYLWTYTPRNRDTNLSLFSIQIFCFSWAWPASASREGVQSMVHT